MHTITVNKRRGHKFEGKQRVIYRRIWREERQGRSVVIIYNFKKERKINKKEITANVGKNMRKWEPLYTSGMDANWPTNCRNQYGHSSKNENRATIWPSYTTRGYISKRL